MMRVLQVIGAMDRGGAETMLMSLYRAINRSEIQFDFLVHENRKCDYDDEIEEMGGRIYRLPRYNILNNRQYRSLCRQHFASHPEHRIVHGHIGSSSGVYLAEAKRAQRTTILHSHSQNFYSFPMRQAFYWLVRSGLKKADEFIACSPEAGLDLFGQDVVSGNHYRVLKNGINVDVFSCDDNEHEKAKSALGLSGRTVIGHVGRFAPEKNHAFLLQVFAEYRLSDSSAKLLLLGRGPLERDVRRLADDLELGDSVVFCGVRNDVSQYTKAFDLFLFPSTSEGLGLSAIEAQASGARCIVSTGVPSCAVVGGKAKRIPLSSGPKKWASIASLLVNEEVNRIQGAIDVRLAGYDIADSAQVLTTLYQNLNQMSCNDVRDYDK